MFPFRILVAKNEVVDCDKGKMPTKDNTAVISLDDLVSEKNAGQSVDKATETLPKGGYDFKGNL